MDVIAALTCTMSRPFRGILLTGLRCLWGHRILRPTKSDYPPQVHADILCQVRCSFLKAFLSYAQRQQPAEGTSIRSTVSQHLPSETLIWVNSSALNMQRTGKRFSCCFSDKMERAYPAGSRCRKKQTSSGRDEYELYSRAETKKRVKSRSNQNKTLAFTVLDGAQLCPCGYKIASQLSLIWERLAPLKAPYHIASPPFSSPDFFHPRRSAPLCSKRSPQPLPFFSRPLGKFVLPDKTDKKQRKSMRNRSTETVFDGARRWKK